MRWVAVVPVKDPNRAKSRLGPELETWRTDLAAAFATDTLSALLAASRVDVVVVVGGQRLPADLLEHDRVRTLPDPGDLNAAAAEGIAWAQRRHPDSAVLVLAGDLPAATGEAIDRLLGTRPAGPLHVIPDIERTGSTGLLIGQGVDVTPAFGGGSLSRHQAVGAQTVELPGIERLRRDVDTADQLAAAVGLGVGERTRQVLAEMADGATDRGLP
jgi:2-phospho-L-lactate/phosphoenolpyruvate guanylyltransferase